jgi:hypothetical protein
MVFSNLTYFIYVIIVDNCTLAIVQICSNNGVFFVKIIQLIGFIYGHNFFLSYA